ncbi:probable RNA-directed DNA polymerase from transposon X-element [Trichonephila clavipes]|nr:probable RNA-directed DNA polymerase from transposon X-element [Trichonephila clavipes]
MLRHLHPNSLANILFLFNRVWKEHCFSSSWREAIVIPILKPSKVATDPLSYRPIALTSCFCKTFERMVSTRFEYVLEKEKCISPLQSGFRKSRSTLDNLVLLESQIRDAFVRRNHLVSLFFDIEKAYDRTWRYGILRNIYDFGLRGNLPIFIFNFLAVRYFKVRIGHSSSFNFIQDQGVPQSSVLSVTLFNIHMSNILHQLPPSVRGILYVDDLQVSCQGSDIRLIERQLQTTVNRLVKWCDQNGHTISPSKSNCVHFCRKRNLQPDPSIHIGNIHIPVVSAVRFLGVIFDSKLTFLPHVLYLRKKVSLIRVYQALILSRLDYGCVVYGSARASALKRLDTVHHSALRICSGAIRTSPVTSLYVVCHQPPLELRRRQLSANYFIRAMSIPSHPLKPFALAIGLNGLYEARSFNIKHFSERAKAALNDAHLNNINIQENNILAFPPWDIQIFNYHNPFSGYDKSGTAAVIYHQLFSFHRSKYSKYIPVYTGGSKSAGHVGCDVVFNNTILSFSLHNSMSVFSAELTVILVALQHILISDHHHFCVYTDSMSALESLHFSTEHRHPTVIEILLLLRKLERKGFDIIFSWVPGHVGILGNEKADTAARSMSDHMQRSVCCQDLKTSAQNYIHRVWQETWDQQVLNKLHSIHPSTSHWAALPVRRHDVHLIRLRIGHTRFTHRHLLLAWPNLAFAPLNPTLTSLHFTDHCLCLLNHEEPTYLHEPTRSFHTIDLAICLPSLLPHLNLSVEKDLYNSDHFPVILSHDSDPGGKTFPPTYSYRRADWALFTQLAVITDAMVKTESIDTAVQEVTNVLIAAADFSILKSSSHSFQHYKPWWNADCQTAYKNQRKLWGIFRRYPTTENLLAFKTAKANARRVRRRSQRQSWIRYVSSLTSSTSSKQLWKRVWKEHCFSSSWREAIVIPILKPSKVATDPLSYRPIALTSCFCKTFERMVSTRFEYVLEKEKCISPLQSGFRKSRSTLDNLVLLESQIRDAFVRRNHLVSLFFDIEKAYDRTWRYGILRNI